MNQADTVGDPTTTMTLTETLAGFSASMRLDDVPDDVVHEARRSLVDHLAVTLAGAEEPGSEKMRRTALRLAPSPQATVIGSPRRTSAQFAALVNGYAAHVLDFDDTYNPFRTTIHGSSSVWPVIMAISELKRVTGREALEAFVAGFETEARVATAAGPAHYDAGWHVTGTAGHIGAAAAATKILALPTPATTHALGCAATQAAGLKEMYGSDCKALHPGKAAMDGLVAGVLAEEGITAARTSLEGSRGLLRVMSSDPDERLLVEGLNSTWHLAANGHKAYPSGSLTHPCVDALITMRGRTEFSPEDLVAITLEVHTYAKTVTGNPSPSTRNEARFSLPHCAAIAVTKGRLTLADFEESVVNASPVARVRNLTDIRIDPALSKRSAKVIVEFRDESRLEESVEGNRGTPENPLTDQDLGHKFLEIGDSSLGSAVARSILERCWNLEDVDDLAHLVGDLAGAG